MKSPLLLPVTAKDKVILVLDETKLPFETSYIKVENLQDSLTVLKAMKTRSLGQVLLFFYSCQLFTSEVVKIDDICAKFQECRPTFDFSMLAQIIKEQVGNSVALKDVVTGFIDTFEQARKERSQRLARVLPQAANILTLCNVNGELLYLYEALQKINKKAVFYILETRPYLQGTRLTFWELTENNITAKVVCDNQAALLMKSGLVNCVVVGADRANFEGDIINKIGTYAVAMLAKHFKVPFYPLIQYPRNINIDSVEIEERPEEETFMFLGGTFSNTDAVYPSFDVTRRDYITQPVKLKMYGDEK